MAPELLLIEARLPRPAGLELSARLLAARPQWDIEVEEDGLSFALPLIPGRLDQELTTLEEACGHLERTRAGLELELRVRRAGDDETGPGRPLPEALGPWRLVGAEDDGVAGPERFQLRLPDSGWSASGRWQAGEALLLTALADHFSPPPGAPETRGRPTLIMESAPPLAAAAAALAGSGPVSLLTEPEAAETAVELAGLNRLESRPEIFTGPFKTLARQRPDWSGRFGLIALHLSPYLAARRLKTLAGWLRPEGVLIVSGFAPGPQTAHLLRAAARAGLILAGSVSEGDWAAMKLEPAPPRPELPPLTGSLVPELEELPEILSSHDATEEDENGAKPPDEGLLLADDEDEDE